MHKVINIYPMNNYRILTEFENSEKRIYNVEPLLNKPVFAFLKDISLFRKAYIEYGAVTWKDKNGSEIDICPDKMYMDSIPIQKRENKDKYYALIYAEILR